MEYIGQSKTNESVLNLLRKVKYPVIFVESESDWYSKAGIEFNSSATWSNIIDALISQWGNCVNVIVTGTGVTKLANNSNGLLPSYLNSLDLLDVAVNCVLHISVNANNSYSPGIVSPYSVIELYYTSINIHETYKFTLVQMGSNPNTWRVDRPIDLFLYSSDNPIYDNFILNLTNVKTTQNSFNPTKFQVEFIISNYPPLNPIRKTDFGGYRPLSVITEGTVVTRDSQLYVDFDFNKYISGLDVVEGMQYLLKYNGSATYKLTNNNNNTYTMSQMDNKLFTQIYLKPIEFLRYTMTHREKKIGDKFCYINSIKLLP